MDTWEECIKTDPRPWSIERSIYAGYLGGPMEENEYWWLVEAYLTQRFAREAGTA